MTTGSKLAQRLSIKQLRAMVKLIQSNKPVCMQRIHWFDSAGHHSKFYGYRQRLAAKKHKK